MDGHCAARRARIARQICCFFDSGATPQSIISSMVRWHPLHKPVCTSIWQIPVQGEGKGPACVIGSKASEEVEDAVIVTVE